MISNQPGIQDILPKDHLLSKLYSEHAVIKSVLDSMESGSASLMKADNFEQAKSVLKALEKGVKNLLNAEPHHQREEEILFPMMESQGVNGPPSVMRSEHETLREGKHHLNNLLADESVGNFSAYRENIAKAVNFIVEFLRAHIHKEDMILYPMAFRAIQGDGIWQEMKERSDRIGDCNFNI